MILRPQRVPFMALVHLAGAGNSKLPLKIVPRDWQAACADFHRVSQKICSSQIQSGLFNRNNQHHGPMLPMRLLSERLSAGSPLDAN